MSDISMEPLLGADQKTADQTADQKTDDFNPGAGLEARLAELRAKRELSAQQGIMGDSIVFTSGNQKIVAERSITAGGAIYSVFHFILILVALYLSNKCNGGKFNFFSLLASVCCPHVYLIYLIAVKGLCTNVTKA